MYIRRLPLLLCLLLGAALLASPAMAGTQGTRWFKGDLKAALTQAKRSKKRVLVKFEAAWCGPCRKLGKEVFHTPNGRKLTRDFIAVRVDFDAPANRGFIEKYVVLGLPTTAVLEPDGTQVLRIMGYDGKAPFERLLATAGAAKDPLAPLQQQHEATPGDDDVRLALGKALLVRSSHGDKRHVQARAMLEPLLWRQATGVTKADRAQAERAAEVLFTLGRYHHRVRRDPATAQHLWRELATRFPQTSFAGGAWWWFARSQAEMGRAAAGTAVLRARALAHPAHRSALSQWIGFAAKHHLTGEVPALTAAIARYAKAGGSDADGLRGKVKSIAGNNVDKSGK
ncbi:MAG: thioredoxin family protein [Myxococcales bacterium]|nr:thioredoxin family protein [Myxococcales bacterium]